MMLNDDNTSTREGFTIEKKSSTMSRPNGERKWGKDLERAHAHAPLVQYQLNMLSEI
jgi:hypothetical protein